MAINLSSYKAIATGLFVRIAVDYYKSSPGASPTSEVLRFSDWNQTVTINSEQYLGLGGLVGITASTSELRTTPGQLTITISGIPNTSIAEIVNSRIKGSEVKVYRMIFDSATQQPLAIADNPVGRFFGIVNNYSLDEEYDFENKTAYNVITLTCSSTVELLTNKVAGRKTNTNSQKTFYPNDVSMDRVASLVGANFNFGAPQ